MCTRLFFYNRCRIGDTVFIINKPGSGGFSEYCIGGRRTVEFVKDKGICRCIPISIGYKLIGSFLCRVFYQKHSTLGRP